MIWSGVSLVGAEVAESPSGTRLSAGEFRFECAHNLEVGGA